MPELTHRRTVEPAALAIDLEAFKRYARIPHTLDDDVIQSLFIEPAIDDVENLAGLSLITQTLTYDLSAWPADDVIHLPRPPLQTVSSITYLDAAGTQTTLAAAAYRVTNAGRLAFGRVAPAYGETWPTLYPVDFPITIVAVTGFGAAYTAIPPRLRRLVYLRTLDLYEQRESITAGVQHHEIPSSLAFDRAIRAVKMSRFGD